MRGKRQVEASSPGRRRFLEGAGILAAGAAVEWLVPGCAANQIFLDIPCTVIAAPEPVAGMTYLRASALGCALDCDLSTGRNLHNGGSATDDGPRINAAMASASATNPITLIIDGGALISGLFLPAGGNWGIAGLGCGTGFYIKSGTNNDGIHNGGPTAAQPSDPGTAVPGIAVPARGSNVSLSNFILNGNRGDGNSGNSTTGKPQGGAAGAWLYGINLMNLNDITIQGVTVVNSAAYHMRLSNVGNVQISGCTTNTLGPNTDGIHFDGPANDIAISNCNLTSGDDAIALNCPEGYGGDIARVTVTGCTFSGFSMIRLLTIDGTGNPAFNIDTVTVTGCNGTAVRGIFLIGEGGASSQYRADGLVVTDCNFIAPGILDLSANFGTLSLTNVTMAPGNIPNDINEDVGYGFTRTIQYDRSGAYTGTAITLANCSILRGGDYPVAGVILEDGSVIGSVEFNGFAVVDPSGSAYAPGPALLDMYKGTIGQVTIDALNSMHLTGPVSSGVFSGVGAIGGAGVLATGWEIPDAVMANGSPYVSANSGLPSIKVGGVVRPYP